MTWTQGQPARRDQSPFFEPTDQHRTYPNPGQSTSTSNIPDLAATFTMEGLQQSPISHNKVKKPY